MCLFIQRHNKLLSSVLNNGLRVFQIDPHYESGKGRGQRLRLIRSKLQFIILDDFSNVTVCFFFFFGTSPLIFQPYNLFIMFLSTISSPNAKIGRTVILIFHQLFQFFGNFSVLFLLYDHLDQWRRFTDSSLLMITKFGFRTWMRCEFRI